ncbi:MAG: ribonuclease D [Methylococcales bacterium]
MSHNNTNPRKHFFVDTPNKLKLLADQLQNENWIALDTEFLRERTYFSKFCLLQIATTDFTACVDPLALDDLEPLLDVIYSKEITKVFHAGRQDLEIFYQLTAKVPTPLFDTQIAAPLLGYPEQMGYANLVSQMLGKQLSKAHTRTDWSKRPLTKEQIEYAIDDVLYLAHLYEIITEKLITLKRLEWLQEDLEVLANPSLYENPPENAWHRIKSASKAKGAHLSALQILAQWREKTAREKDLPRNWILKDETIFDIARLLPLTISDLSTIRSIHKNVLTDHGEAICRIIKNAIQHPPAHPLKTIYHRKKTADEEALLDIMMAFVRLHAEKSSITPSVLASKKDLEQLLYFPTSAKVLQGWRKQLIGEKLMELLKGDRCIKINDGNISL